MIDLDLTRGGCSDLGALAGVDKYRGPFALYNRIAHGIQPAASDWLQELGDLGQEGELATARVACRRHLRKDPSLLFKPESRLIGKHLRYSLDFVTGLDLEGEVRSPEQLILEVKRRAEYEIDRNWGPPGSGEVDRAIWCQVQGQMEAVRRDRDYWVGTNVPELEEVTVTVEVWPRGVLLYPVRRQAEVGARLLDELEAFVANSRQGIVPAAAAADRDTAVALAAKSKVSGAREATEAEEKLFGEREAIRAQLKALEQRNDELEALLAQSIAASGLDTLKVGGGRMKAYERRGRPGWKEAALELGKELGKSEPDVLVLAESHRGPSFPVLSWWANRKKGVQP